MFYFSVPIKVLSQILYIIFIQLLYSMSDISTKKMQAASSMHQFLEIKTVTWSKDSHELFDYQSKSCHQNKFKLKIADLSIFRTKKGQILIADTPELKKIYSSEDHTLLIQLKKRKHRQTIKLFISNSNQKNNESESQHLKTQQSLNDEELHDNVYLIVRSLKNSDNTNKGHNIEIGQQIKLGRAEYSVIQLKTGDNVQICDSSYISFLKNQSRFEETQTQIQKGATCKICIEQHQTAENFLLTPCKCTGSCQYVHIQCLRRWIQSKVKKQVIGGTAYYNFQKFECEICKTQLPKYIVKNGIHELLKITRPLGDYLILQEIGEGKRDLIIIQNLPPEGIKIGRGHQCQIRVSDISVSREHANIKLIDNQFYIFDNNSKFGTLIKQRGNIEIGIQKKAFQVGRTVLTFAIRKQKMEKKTMNMEHHEQFQ